MGVLFFPKLAGKEDGGGDDEDDDPSDVEVDDVREVGTYRGDKSPEAGAEVLMARG